MTVATHQIQAILCVLGPAVLLIAEGTAAKRLQELPTRVVLPQGTVETDSTIIYVLIKTH